MEERSQIYKEARHAALNCLGRTQVDLVQTIDIALKSAIEHDEISEARAVEVWERLEFYGKQISFLG